MKIGKKDWIFITVIGIVVIVFIVISGEEKTKKVPFDERHRPAYDIMKKTGNKIDADVNCPTCHFDNGGVPFPAKHPVKPKDGPMRCLFCHKLEKGH